MIAHDKLTPALTAATNATQKFAGISAKSLVATGLKFLGVTSAAYATYKAIKFAVTSYSDFSASMAEVSTLVDTSKVNMDAMTQSVLRFSNATGVDAAQAAKALYQTISAGVDASKAMEVLSVAQKTALGGVAGLTESVDLLTNILNAYHLSANKAIDVSDKMFIAVKEGKTTIPELAQSLGMVAPIAAQAGVGIGEMAAATAELTKGGLNTSEAVTGLRQLINSIISPSAEAAKYAHKLGLAFSAKTLQHEGLIKFLTQLREKTGGSVDKLTKLIPDVRALNAVLALTGSGYKDLIRINNEMNDSFGATDTAADKMRQTFRYQAQLAGTHVKNAFIALGNAIAFVLKPALEAFNGLFGGGSRDEKEKMSKLNELMNAYTKLKEKVKPTADELARMQRLRNEIADLSPSLVKAYNAEGDAISVDTTDLVEYNTQYALNEWYKTKQAFKGMLSDLKKQFASLNELRGKVPSQALQNALGAAQNASLAIASATVGMSPETKMMLTNTSRRMAAIEYVKNPKAFPDIGKLAEHDPVMKAYINFLKTTIDLQKQMKPGEINKIFMAFSMGGLKAVEGIAAPTKEISKMESSINLSTKAFINQANALAANVGWIKQLAASLPNGDPQRKALLNNLKMMAQSAEKYAEKLLETYSKGMVKGSPAIIKSLKDIIGIFEDYMKFHSPTRKGPFSNILQWGAKLIPTWLEGVKTGAGKMNSTIQGILGPVQGFFSKIGMNNIASGIGSIMGKFTHIKGMIGDIVGGAKGIMQIFTGNPVGGIMTVITKIVSLMKSTPEGRKALQKVFEVFKKIEKPVGKILDSVIKILTPLVDLLGDILAPIADFLADAIINPLNWLIGVINGIINAFQKFFGAIAKIGKAIFDFLIAPFKWIFDAVSGFLGWLGGLFGLNNNKAHENVQKAKEASKAEASKREQKTENKHVHIGTVEVHSNASDPKAVADEVLRRLGLEAVAHG